MPRRRPDDDEPDDDDMLTDSSHEIADALTGVSRRGRKGMTHEEAVASFKLYQDAKAEAALVREATANGTEPPGATPALDELHRRYQLKQARARGEVVSDEEFEAPVRNPPPPKLEECQECGENIVAHKGTEFLHTNPKFDADHDAVPSRTAKSRLVKRDQPVASNPARPAKASAPKRSTTTVSETTTANKRRVLVCGHTKLWKNEKKWVNNPICEECTGRPTRAVVALEEKKGTGWVKITPPKGAKLVEAKPTEKEAKQTKGIVDAVVQSAKNGPNAKATKAAAAKAKKAAPAKKAPAKKAGAASTPLKKAPAPRKDLAAAKPATVAARKATKRVTRKR